MVLQTLSGSNNNNQRYLYLFSLHAVTPTFLRRSSLVLTSRKECPMAVLSLFLNPSSSWSSLMFE